MRGRAAPPHPRIYRVPPPGALLAVAENFCLFGWYVDFVTPYLLQELSNQFVYFSIKSNAHLERCFLSAGVIGLPLLHNHKVL